MKVPTVHFGELDVREEDIFVATSPIPGFPNSRRFIFFDREKIAPFRWLQSVEDAALTFVVVDPAHFFFEYNPRFFASDLKEVGYKEDERPIIYAIVVLPEDMSKMTANLRGPLIVNTEKRMLKQVFLDTEKFSVRESIVEGIKKKEQSLLEKQRNQSGVVTP